MKFDFGTQTQRIQIRDSHHVILHVILRERIA